VRLCIFTIRRYREISLAVARALVLDEGCDSQNFSLIDCKRGNRQHCRYAYNRCSCAVHVRLLGSTAINDLHRVGFGRSSIFVSDSTQSQVKTVCVRRRVRITIERCKQFTPDFKSAFVTRHAVVQIGVVQDKKSTRRSAPGALPRSDLTRIQALPGTSIEPASLAFTSLFGATATSLWELALP
jgi:hypothetical protein